MYLSLMQRCIYTSVIATFLLLILVACGGATTNGAETPSQHQVTDNVVPLPSEVTASDSRYGELNLQDLSFRSMPMAKSAGELNKADAVSFKPQLKPLFAGTSRVGMSLLIISANGNPANRDGSDPMLDAATFFAEQIGIPFDVMIAQNEQLTEARLLEANGDGKYQGIILTNSALTFNNAGVFESAFDTAEWNLLWQYAREFNVRQLSLDSFPGAFPEDLGLREASSTGTTTDSPLNIGITAAGQDIFGSLKASATIPIKNAFVNLATVCSEDPVLACPAGVTTTPILRDNSTNQIVGTVSRTADNREVLNLTMGHNYFLTHTALLSYDLFKWVTQGVFIGAREMYLQMDIDDWYQASAIWDPAINANGSETYRITGFDVQSTKRQLDNLRSRFSVAQDLNITNAIVTAQGDFTATVDCSDGASLESATLCLKDDFDWVSHTYTERVMNFESPGYNNQAYPLYNAEDPDINGVFKGFTCDDSSITGFNPTSIGEEIALKEIICNSQKLLQLDIPFSPDSIITSAHSGLGHYNPDPNSSNLIDNGLGNSSPALLGAMTSAGLKYMASNHSVLSHRGVCEVCGRYHPNYPQIFLIPRYPTYIFFNATDPFQIESEFNYLFGPNGTFLDGFGNNFFSTNQSYQDIINLDAENTLRHISSLQPYMHFFHQNNLKNYTGANPGRSLWYDWTEAFLELYSSYYSIPLLTLNWTEQAANIERRTSFYNSGAKGVWDRAAGIVTVTSTNGGFVFVTNAGFSNVATTSYGGDVIQKFGLVAGEARLSTTTSPTQNPNVLPVVTPIIPPPAVGDIVNFPQPTDPNALPNDPSVNPNPTNPTNPGPTNPTPLNNVLVNGGFENNQASWSICGTGQTNIVDDVTEGSNAMNLSGSNGACLFQEINDITIGESYIFLCDAKRNDSSVWSSIGLAFSSADYSTEYPGDIQEIVGSSYSQVGAVATVPAGAARAVVVLYSQDSATVDNCVFAVDDGGTVPAPQPPQPTNALVNGDFENGQASWINCSASGTSTDADAISGSSALRVAEGGCVYQEVISSAGDDLTLSCQAKRADGRYVSLTLSYLDSGFQTLQQQIVPITETNYQNYNINLVAPVNTAYAVATFYSESVAHFDACVLNSEGVPIPAPPVPPAPPTGDNLLTNGGFESGRAGWQDCSAQGLSVDSDAASGTSALSVTSGGCIYQEVEVAAALDLTLSCQAKNAGSGFTSLTFSYLDSNFQALQDESLVVNTASYQNYSTNLVSPPNARYAVATLYSDAVAHFDVCSLSTTGGTQPPPPPPTPIEQDSVIVASSGSGQWGAVQQWPLIATHMANLTDGRVLAWSSYDVNGFGGRPDANYTQSTIFNPETGTFEEADNPTHDMFCAGLVTLSDGTIFAAGGGDGNASRSKVSIFDGSTWSRLADMPNPHWYGTAVVDADDDVIVSLGASSNRTTDFFSNGSWRNLSGVSLAGTAQAGLETPDWYPQMHLSPRGTIFHSGGTTQMHELTTAGSGTTTSRGSRNQDGVTDEVYRQWATAVMIDDGQIMMTGGTPQQNTPGSLNSNVLIDINSTNPVVTKLAPMRLSRSYHDTIILPNGEIFVVGGNSTGVEFNDGGSRLITEMYNPATNTWRDTAALGEPRNYHSTATLLQDGRVLAAGGGLCRCAADHQNGEIYSPPYLFNADGSAAARPEISTAPSNISYNQSFNVSITGSGANDIQRFAMIKFSAVTHQINSDLRQDALRFTNQGDGFYELKSGSNRNVVTPGYYYLFAVNASGVPSVASIIQIR